MDIDIQKLESLLDAKKYDEARELINAAVSENLTQEQRGAALAGIASVYVEVSNAINARYKDALEEAVAGIKQLKAAESRANDKVKLAGLRSDLGK